VLRRCRRHSCFRGCLLLLKFWGVALVICGLQAAGSSTCYDGESATPAEAEKRFRRQFVTALRVVRCRTAAPPAHWPHCRGFPGRPAAVVAGTHGRAKPACRRPSAARRSRSRPGLVPCSLTNPRRRSRLKGGSRCRSSRVPASHALAVLRRFPGWQMNRTSGRAGCGGVFHRADPWQSGREAFPALPSRICFSRSSAF